MADPKKAADAPRTSSDVSGRPAEGDAIPRAEHQAALEAVRTEAREAVLSLRAQFDRAWADRETELAPRGASAFGPVRATVEAFGRKARVNIRCLVAGAPRVIPAGAPIPDGADLTGIGPDAIEEG